MIEDGKGGWNSNLKPLKSNSLHKEADNKGDYYCHGLHRSRSSSTLHQCGMAWNERSDGSQVYYRSSRIDRFRQEPPKFQQAPNLNLEGLDVPHIIPSGMNFLVHPLAQILAQGLRRSQPQGFGDGSHKRHDNILRIQKQTFRPSSLSQYFQS